MGEAGTISAVGARNEVGPRSAGEREAPLVHQPVVVATEQDQVLEAGLAATGPVDDVVGVDEAVALTARKLTSPVAHRERPAHRGRDRAGSSPDARVACRPARRGDDRAIAGKTPRGLGRDPGPVGDRAAAAARGHAGARAIGGQRRGSSGRCTWFRSPAVRAQDPVGGRASAVSAIAVSDSALLGGGRRGSPRGRFGRRRFRGTARPKGGKRSRGTVRALCVGISAPVVGLVRAPLAKRVARRLERAEEERPVLGRQLRVEVQTAVVVVPGPAHEALALLLVGLGRAHPARRAGPCARAGQRSRGARAPSARPRPRRRRPG